jgi:hypothetical protein
MACSSRAGAIQIAGTPKAGSRVSLAGQRTRPGVAGDGQQAALRSASGRSPSRAARTDTRAASGADCPRYARAAPEIPSPTKDGGAASAPGSAVARPASRRPAESAGKPISRVRSSRRSRLARSEPCACSAFFFSTASRLGRGRQRRPACAFRPRKARRPRKKCELRQSRNQAHGRRDQAGQIERGRRASSCWRISPPSMPAELARVSVMPPATETSSEGIRVTRPSPTVSTV